MFLDSVAEKAGLFEGVKDLVTKYSSLAVWQMVISSQSTGPEPHAVSTAWAKAPAMSAAFT